MEVVMMPNGTLNGTNHLNLQVAPLVSVEDHHTATEEQ